MALREVTITRDDLPKKAYIIPLLHVLIGLFFGVIAVTYFASGNWGLGLFEVFIMLTWFVLANIWWSTTRWEVLFDKYNDFVYEDIAESRAFTRMGKFDEALAVLNRTESVPKPTRWELAFKFPSHLIVK